MWIWSVVYHSVSNTSQVCDEVIDGSVRLDECLESIDTLVIVVFLRAYFNDVCAGVVETSSFNIENDVVCLGMGDTLSFIFSFHRFLLLYLFSVTQD